jgi:hypothetical protein
MVALLQSKHGYESSNINLINTIGATRGNVAFDHGCFHACRNETTLQKWLLSVPIIFPKRLIYQYVRNLIGNFTLFFVDPLPQANFVNGM